MNNSKESIANFVKQRNDDKFIFTAGPASLLEENITGLRPCFGRGDEDYLTVETRVINALSKISGHDQTVRLQGSASLALEIMALNFLYGRVLVISTGYYSDRLLSLVESSQRRIGEVKDVKYIDWQNIDSIDGQFDWVFACPTETSCGLKLPIEDLRSLADRLEAKLMLDATASIGLESGHDMANVIGYSSCKGLFGLTGAAFIAYNEKPTIKVDSFYLDINSHIEHKMTGPYHAIASLDAVLDQHSKFKAAVVNNKQAFMDKMKDYLTLPISHQPLLCTHVNCKISSKDNRSVLYTPRSNKGGSVVCHLGEVHLANTAEGKILDVLEIDE